MRYFIFTFVLILSSGIFVFGQTNNDSTCPSISVSGPSGFIEPNAHAIYTLIVVSKEKHPNLEFFWTTSAGEIISGQGTKTIVVRQPDQGITVTVDVKGLPNNCQNYASETATYDPPPQGVKLDEFSGSVSNIDKTRFEEISRAIQHDPTAQLCILDQYKRKTQPKRIDRKETEIKNELIKAGADKSSITFVRREAETDLVEFWFVPAGATPPK